MAEIMEAVIGMTERFIVSESFTEENGLYRCSIETTDGRVVEGTGGNELHSKYRACQNLIGQSLTEATKVKAKTIKMFNGVPLSSFYKTIQFVNLGEACGYDLASGHTYCRTTLCVLTLAGGFTIIGKSDASSMGHFNRAIGEETAKDDAENKLIEYLVFDIKTKQGETTSSDDDKSKLYSRLLGFSCTESENGFVYSYQLKNVAGVIESCSGPVKETKEEASCAALVMFEETAKAVDAQEDYMKSLEAKGL